MFSTVGDRIMSQIASLGRLWLRLSQWCFLAAQKMSWCVGNRCQVSGAHKGNISVSLQSVSKFSTWCCVTSLCFPPPKIILAILQLFHLHINFKSRLSISTKISLLGIFILITLNLLTNLGRTDALTMLSFPNMNVVLILWYNEYLFGLCIWFLPQELTQSHKSVLYANEMTDGWGP